MDAGYAHQRLLPDVREMSKVPGPAIRSLTRCQRTRSVSIRRASPRCRYTGDLAAWAEFMEARGGLIVERRVSRLRCRR